MKSVWEEGKFIIKLFHCIIFLLNLNHLFLRFIYETIDRSLRDIRDSTKHMGGLTGNNNDTIESYHNIPDLVVFSGDWRQTLPIVVNGSEGQIVDSCLKFSYLWPYVKVYHFTVNMRIKLSGNKDDEDYAKWLLEVGEGKNVDENGMIEIPKIMELESERLGDLVEFVYPSLLENLHNLIWLSKRGIICPTNAEADEVNSFILNLIPGEEFIMKSIDSPEDKPGSMESINTTEFPTELLNTLTVPGLPPHSLTLKRGQVVVLLRNLDPANGHCNGVKYQVKNIKRHVVELISISGVNVGSMLFVPRIVMLTASPALPFQLRRKQFPLK